jgi:hypothetical protein
MAILCAGLVVISGTIDFTLPGAWFADLELDSDIQPVGRVAIVAEDTKFALSGTVTRSGFYADRTRVRVVAGAGGLAVSTASEALPEDDQSACPLSTRCRPPERSCRRSRASALLAAPLASWARAAGPAGIRARPAAHAPTRRLVAVAPERGGLGRRRRASRRR